MTKKGRFYVGELIKSRQGPIPHGHGTYVWENGEKYVGQWEHNERTGFGSFHWPSGASHAGGYKDGKKHGYGRYTWADGHQRESLFSDGEEIFRAPIEGKTASVSLGRTYLNCFKCEKVTAWSASRLLTRAVECQECGTVKTIDGRPEI